MRVPLMHTQLEYILYSDISVHGYCAHVEEYMLQLIWSSHIIKLQINILEYIRFTVDLSHF